MLGTERTAMSERPSSLISFPFFSFLARPHHHCPSPSYFLSSIALVSHSQTMFIDTKATTTRQPYAHFFISFLVFLYALTSPIHSFLITGTPEVTDTIQNLDQLTGTAHVYKTALLLVEDGIDRV